MVESIKDSVLLLNCRECILMLKTKRSIIIQQTRMYSIMDISTTQFFALFISAHTHLIFTLATTSTHWYSGEREGRALPYFYTQSQHTHRF